MSDHQQPGKAGKSVLSCKGLVKTFGEDGLQVEVLRGVDFAIGAGETCAIVGASGCGKSTLLHLLGGLDTPTSGEIFLDGRNLSKLNQTQRGVLRNKSLGFVYQFHHLLMEFDAIENVAMPLRIAGWNRQGAEAEALKMIDRVGLADRSKHRPAELSGGERQRIALARAMVTRPKCILADEPTGNLDQDTASQIFELMLQLNRESGASLVIVTHEMGLAARLGQIFRLDHGLIQAPA